MILYRARAMSEGPTRCDNRAGYDCRTLIKLGKFWEVSVIRLRDLWSWNFWGCFIRIGGWHPYVFGKSLGKNCRNLIKVCQFWKIFLICLRNLRSWNFRNWTDWIRCLWTAFCILQWCHLGELRRDFGFFAVEFWMVEFWKCETICPLGGSVTPAECTLPTRPNESVLRHRSFSHKEESKGVSIGPFQQLRPKAPTLVQFPMPGPATNIVVFLFFSSTYPIF